MGEPKKYAMKFWVQLCQEGERLKAEAKRSVNTPIDAIDFKLHENTRDRRKRF